MARRPAPNRDELQIAAVRLRRRGHDYLTIAAQIGCSKSQAHRLVKAAYQAVVVEEVGQLRAIELERLDLILERANDIYEATKSDYVRLRALDRMLKVGEYRRRLLGLDAPTATSMEVSGPQALTVVFDAALAPTTRQAIEE